MNTNKKILAIGLVIATLMMTGCRTRETKEKLNNEQITLTYYKLFDNSDVMDPIISAYQQENPNIQINYKKFANYDLYIDTIVNEMAAGEGPDIFSMQNTWFTSNYKKLAPLNKEFATIEAYKDTFVDVAAKDLIRPNEDGYMRIYGIPFTIDTLAIYYNKDHFNDVLPAQRKPSITWEGIKNDVIHLNKFDNSSDEFAVSGIALGTGNNITRAADIIYLLMLQHGVDFYDDKISKAIFASQKNNKKTEEAFNLYKSFADPDQKHYSWNNLTADENSEEKELEAFAKGEVSMIIGYSYTYNQIQNYIKVYKEKGIDTIDKDAVQIAPIPQLYDPKVSTKKRVTYANYFAETVSRNSKHPDEAWQFLMFASSPENLETYHQKTKKPTSLRSMIDHQSKDPIYGVFAQQIGYSESFPILNYEKYKEAFINTIEQNTPNINQLQTTINKYIPSEGIMTEAIEEPEDNKEDKDNTK